MIDLNKDLFIHLSMSAKALKLENARKALMPKRPVLSNLERTSYSTVKPVKVEKPKTMEETIEEVVENPKVKALKKELDNAEEIFDRLKEGGENADFIYRIENKISQLRKIIDDKSYY